MLQKLLASGLRDIESPDEDVRAAAKKYEKLKVIKAPEDLDALVELAFGNYSCLSRAKTRVNLKSIEGHLISLPHYHSKHAEEDIFV